MAGAELIGKEELAEEDVRPRTSWRASREFRLHLIRTLAKKVVRQAVENQGGAL